MFGLPSWVINAIGAALLALVVAGVGAHVAQLWYAPQIAGYKASAKAEKVQAKAVKTLQTSLTKTSGAAEDKAQAEIQVQTRTIIKKVPVYVSSAPRPPIGCITTGMLRLHDAAVLGIDPGDLRPPAGELDGACSAVSPSDFMAAVASNYGAARANAEQLTGLEVDIRSRIEALDPAK